MGSKDMTDQERLEWVLKKMNVDFETEDRSGPRYGRHGIVIRGGQPGLHCTFVFARNGGLLSVGVWEDEKSPAANTSREQELGEALRRVVRARALRDAAGLNAAADDALAPPEPT